MANTISLRSLLEKEKLNGINFLDWFRNLRIVLKQERKEYVIEEPVPDEPAANAPRADKDKFKKDMDDDKCLLALCFRMIFTPLRVICRELIGLGKIQKQQDLDEGSCTEATPIEKT
ncbi:hypothetical protein V6N13_109574 [Hibiscus sabdariffa]|uniref:Zinc finger, CCHC-type n=1 Tax=Hibiscus sabdariffa TaxID=183260 RepID=A0ABR2FQ26_9ROSI